MAPAPDHDSAPWWDGLVAGELRLQRCSSCARLRFPRMPACPWCGSRDWTEATHPGDGVVYSYVVVHRPFDPAFADDVPYTLAVVELTDGPRIAARLDDVDEPRIGMAVTARFVAHDGWTELRFGP